MKKKELILTIIFTIIITLVICFLIIPEKKNESIEEYNYDYICSYETYMESDEVLTDKKIIENLYLKVDNDLVVTAIYESVYENDSFNKPLNDLTQGILDLYNEFDGIDTKIYSDKKNTYVSISYDYNVIDFDEVKKGLDGLVEEDFFEIDKPISIDDYIDKSSEYTCTKK